MNLRDSVAARFGRCAWAPSLAAALLAACAGAKVAPQPPPDAPLTELQGQLRAQSALVADQQRRIEQLEVKLAALSNKLALKEKAAAKAAAVEPAEKADNPVIEFEGAAQQKGAADPRAKLATVKLEPPRQALGRRLRRNPVDRAPGLPTVTNLREPEDGALQRLADSPPARRKSDPGAADQAFARAVQRLNDGDREGAQGDLLAFAKDHPRHAAADNAIYLAGLAAAQSGDCGRALPLFDRVAQEYPAGDAVPQARLEEARCLIRLGRAAEAKAALGSLEKEHPDAPEATQARALLNGL
jgi:TolA-binding protein